MSIYNEQNFLVRDLTQEEIIFLEGIKPSTRFVRFFKAYINPANYRKHFMALCECGNVSYPSLGSIRKGGSKSCGCYKAEASKNRRKFTDEQSVEIAREFFSKNYTLQAMADKYGVSTTSIYNIAIKYRSGAGQ